MADRPKRWVMSPEFQGYIRRAQDARKRYLSRTDLSALDVAAAAWNGILDSPSFSLAPKLFRLAVWDHVGEVFLLRFQIQRLSRDLDRAIEAYQAASSGAPRSSRERHARFNSLSIALLARHAYGGNLEDLDESIRSCRQAIAAAQKGTREWIGYLGNLGNRLHSRYECTGHVGDLEEAIARWQQAEGSLPRDSSDRSRCLNSLGIGLHAQYLRTGDVQFLDRAIDAWHEAVELRCGSDSEHCAYLNGLGIGLRDRYQQAGHPQDLDNAILVWRQAAALASVVSSDAPPILSNLATGLRDSYLRTGRMQDLNDAIELCRQIVDAVSDKNPEKPAYHTSLGNALRTRYLSTGSLEDLDASISAFRAAVAATIPGSPARPRYLTNLGTGLSDRYKRYGSLDDLETAVRLFTEAVAASPSDSSERAGYLSNLGTSMHERYSRTRRIQDLELAIKTFRDAVDAAQPNSRDMPRFLNNLGNGLRDRYLDKGQLQDLDESLRWYRQALSALSSSSPERAGYLNNLANALIDLCSVGPTADGIKEAVRVCKGACQDGLEHSPEVTLASARNWAQWALERRSWAEVVEAYGFGTKAIEHLYYTQTLRTHRESWLKEAHGLHALAAYALARADNRQQAAIAFEEGRARGLGETLARDRADLEQVQAQDPQAYDLYQQAAGRLRALESRERLGRVMGAEVEPALSSAVLTDEIRRARGELDQALARIRQLPGYERFLLAPAFGEMVGTVMPGCPLVYLATTEVGSLALVLHQEPAAPDAEADVQVEAVWAGGFTETGLEGLLVQREGDELTGGYLPGQMFHGGWLQTALEEGLPRLGEHLVGALAGRLRGLGVSRVVLAPTGQLGLLPLHAARYVVDGREMCLLDEFEVGYVPSARVLVEAQREERIRRGHRRHLAGVGNPLENARPLAYARPEMEEVAALFGGDAGRVLYEYEATKDRLMVALPGATHVHLSCHGMFDPDEPLNSHLQLADEEPWTLREILGAECLAQARLVVLSACQTAITDFRNLPDEVIGLPAGFLQAGVPGVVGTLWPVDDLSTMLLMVRFYRYHLRGDEATGERPMAPAGALRRAQLWLRDVTCGELAEVFDGFRQGARDGTRMTYELAQEQMRKYALRDPDERPFAHPYYWSPFVFYGC